MTHQKIMDKLSRAIYLIWFGAGMLFFFITANYVLGFEMWWLVFVAHTLLLICIAVNAYLALNLAGMLQDELISHREALGLKP